MTIDRNCLDAETVAAWMDGGLDAAGVAAAEAHASTCERCQALLSSVVKTLPIEDPMAPGHEARGTARFWRWWLAPIAATAAAVTIWAVVPQTPMQPMQAPSVSSAPARDTADTAAKAEQSAPTQPFAQAPPAVPPPAPADSRRNAPAATEDTKVTVAVTADEAKRDAQAARKDAGAKREENTARPAEARAAAAPVAGADAAERMREMPPSPAAPPAPAAPRVGAVTQLRKQFAAPEIVSPDPTSRWRATTPGTIERSEDGGRTWVAVRVAANEEVLAGASPGRLVSWFVGRNGLVLLATDGTNFTRLPFPESVDLVAVSSPEARIATVTTSDGRTFRTEDAGRNWRNP